MEFPLLELYVDVEKSIDSAFNGKFLIKFYDYLKVRETTKLDIEKFITSHTYQNLIEEISNLNQYLEGGDDSLHKQFREAYGHVPKPQARKIKNYFMDIVNDANKYLDEKNRKKTRTRKKQSK
jgi:hypothetical protein